MQIGLLINYLNLNNHTVLAWKNKLIIKEILILKKV